MSFRATTTISVLRGTSTDDYGDEVDADTEVYIGVPASILEGSPRAQPRPVDGTTVQVRSYTLRVRPNVDVQKGDRVRDERTGAVYTADLHTEPVNPVGHSVTRIDLRKVT